MTKPGGRIRSLVFEGTESVHDGMESRAMRLQVIDHPNGQSDSSFGQLVSAFQEVAAGVEGTHRALIERVEQLTRELEGFRSRSAEQPVLACDGAVTLETVERHAVVATLDRFGGHRDRTAKALGIGVRTLGMKLRQWKSAGLVPEHL